MDGRLFEDLKQFIDSRLSQLEAKTDDKFAAVDAKFVGINARFDSVDSRFASMDKRFDAMDARLDSLESSLEAKIDNLRQEMLDGFAGVGDAIDQIDQIFDERVSKLERHAARVNRKLALK